MLEQSGRRKSAAVKRYVEFVMAGIGMERLWKDVKDQLVLGSKELVEEILKRVEGSKELKEIPKIQRHIDWRLLEELVTGEY